MSKSDELRKQVQDLILKHRTFVNVYQTRNKDVWQMEDYGTVEEIAAHLVAAGFRDVHGADDLMDGDPYAMVQFKLPVDAPANSAPVASADAVVGVTAFPITDDGMVRVSIKEYHNLEREVARLQADLTTTSESEQSNVAALQIIANWLRGGAGFQRVDGFTAQSVYDMIAREIGLNAAEAAWIDDVGEG